MQQLQYIVVGDPSNPSFSFSGDDILGTSGDFSVDMIGAELCTDVMEAEVSYDDADGALRALPWATPVYFYRGEYLEGKLYSVSVTRIGKTAYRVRTTSAAGIMEYDRFYGGMYAGDSYKTVVEGIIRSNGLQPFDGIYRHLFRSKDSTTTAIRGIAMGSNYSCFGAATMSSKLSAKIKINGFSNDSYGSSTATTFRCRLLGASAKSDSGESLKQLQYGLYMDVARADASEPYPEFGEVFFVYEQNNTISLGTPSSAENAVYEIEVDPGAGTAVINGVTYSIVTDNSVADALCALHVYGGGAYLSSFGGVEASAVTHHCNLEVYYYRVQSPNDELLADYAAVWDIYQSKVGAFDCVTHKLIRNIANSTVDSTDQAPYDASAFGEYPLFNNRTSFQSDVLSRLSYADGIDALPIYGYLPICTKREALQQILFATGVILIKDADGSIRFTAPSAQNADVIGDDAIYDEGSNEQSEHINAIELTEHSYVLDTTSETETIYENSAGSSAGYYIAEFNNAPAKQVGLYDGLTVLQTNCNAAIVTGSGYLTGWLYYHAETVLDRTIESFPDGRTAAVRNATLITPLNSEAVLDRLAAYYGNAHKSRVDIIMQGERCGLKYSLFDAFGEAFSGFLIRANKVFTSIIKAGCEFVRGYTPPPIGNGYTNYVILTGSGTWVVPESVFAKETPRIRVVLIGGGHGGDGGFAGADGAQPAVHEGTLPAEGGAAGNSGEGGNVFEVTITSPAAAYEYSCGQGGTGGSISTSHERNNPGSAGGDTTFAGGGQNYSSGNGSSKENGISNEFTGVRYAGQMIRSRDTDVAALSGGGAGGYYSAEAWGSSYHSAASCIEYVMNSRKKQWSGGQPGADYRSDGWVYARGGAGGGAGYGQAGSDGSAAAYSGGTYYSGNGGKGGDATQTPLKATQYNPGYYGYGGLGGGGGGGGGAGGWVLGRSASVIGVGGTGGYGGQGGDGGDGCVLIYY